MLPAYSVPPGPITTLPSHQLTIWPSPGGRVGSNVHAIRFERARSRRPSLRSRYSFSSPEPKVSVFEPSSGSRAPSAAAESITPPVRKRHRSPPPGPTAYRYPSAEPA